MVKAVDVLNMSDEDFLNQNPQPESGDSTSSGAAETTDAGTPENAEGAASETTTTEASTEGEAGNQAENTGDGASTDETNPAADASKVSTETTGDAAATGDAAKTADQTSADAQTGKTGEGDTAGKDGASASAAPDLEGFYKQVMTPFKANGRTIELKSPEEVIQLMQMGANYTKKMQELVPHRKVLTMLQTNGLLDEAKLSYLIDLDKKNPDAIKKLVKDSGIDPNDIDTSVEPAYRQGNHIVSDEEVAFHTALDDMKSSPDRLKTVEVISGTWDQASKEALWKQPGIMAVIHDQRESGVYDRISNEVARRQTLGVIPADVPFLQAYKVVGDDLARVNAFADIQPKAPTPPPVVATRVAAPKPKVTGSDRAAAAAPNRQTPPSVKTSINPLAMSDDEFVKRFEGRL